VPTQEDLAANPYQYTLLDYTTATPEGDTQAVGYTPRYLTDLLQRQDLVEQGGGTPWERQLQQMQVAAANAVPMRDPATLQYDAGEQGPTTLSGGSPDLAGLMLSLRQKMQQGTATDQERQLFDTTYRQLAEQTYRSVVPQASDAFSPFGDNLLSALGILGIGATGGLAGGALAAGGGLASTLGSLGTLSGIAGTGAGVLGQATDQPWLQNLGLGLGIAGGLAGGLGGLSTLWSSGVNSLSDAAKLAQSAGRITGSLGRIPGAESLKDVSRYLGYAGQAGQFGAGLGADDWLGWSGGQSPLAANVAPQSGGQNLLSAADVATQRGGPMSAWDYSWDYGGQQPYDNWSWDAGATTPSAWDTFTGWGGDETQQGWYQNADLDTSGSSGGWLSSVLGGLGGLGRTLLGGGGAGGGTGAGALGSLLSSVGSVGAGAIGGNAANEAARLQAAALNRGVSLQEAQWLQQQQNLAPYLQAGQQGLSQLQQLAGREQPGLPGQMASIDPRAYGMPDATPRWTPQGYQGPQAVNAADYRWNPQQGPQAADYRYAPGQIPQAANYKYTPGAVPTLSGQELLANDPGVAFRLGEGRKALEASAAAKGGLLSGPTLAALQRQGQELSSQEYGSAWNRASQQAQLREGWAQTASQMGWGQAESEARLREQVNQIASQQGWSQAQAEAAFREQQAQLASSQGWTQALQGQQTG